MAKYCEAKTSLVRAKLLHPDPWTSVASEATETRGPPASSTSRSRCVSFFQGLARLWLPIVPGSTPALPAGRPPRLASRDASGSVLPCQTPSAQSQFSCPAARPEQNTLVSLTPPGSPWHFPKRGSLSRMCGDAHLSPHRLCGLMGVAGEGFRVCSTLRRGANQF